MVLLEKQDGQVSEQTFLVVVEASAASPNASIPSATLSTMSSNNDYSIAGPGESVVALEFPPENQTTGFEFTVYPDTLTEGLEAFQLRASRTSFNGRIGPSFSTPSPGSTLFSSTFVLIEECELCLIIHSEIHDTKGMVYRCNKNKS